MNCPQCQQVLGADAKFCHRCGLRITQDQQGRHASLKTTVQQPARLAAAAPASDSLIGQVLEGKYELTARLGEGGMGAVYRARRVHIGDEVAIKILHPRFIADQGALERFRREARAAAMLRHQNVVAIYDYGESQNKAAPVFIVMELVAGRSLRDMLEQEGKLAPPRAVALMLSICAGVGAAHRRNIVHRDLKPDNIIVLPPEVEGEQESAKVVDFGIAKLRDMASESALTQTGTVIGTPYYMSPEQCRADHLDSRSDVYSLGAMLYEMLVGSPPFTAATATGVVAKHLTEPPPPMPAGSPVAAALQGVILRSLAKDPNARQADATEFSRELQAAMGWRSTRPMSPAVTSPDSAIAPPATRVVKETFDTNPTPLQTSPTFPAPNTMPAAPYEQRAHQVATAARPSRAPLVVGLLVLGVIVLLGAAGAFWLLNRPGAGEANRNAARQEEANRNAALPQAPASAVPANANLQANPSIAQANANASAALPSPTPAEPSPGFGNQYQSGPLSDRAMRAEAKILGGLRLSAGDLEGLSQIELRILRNVVYARYGRIFKDPEMQSYFNSRSWYRQRADYRDSELTAADQANIKLIMDAER